MARRKKHNKYAQFSKAKTRRNCKSLKKCFQKRRFVTHNYAEEQRELIEQRKGWSLQTYYCPHCNGFHHTKA